MKYKVKYQEDCVPIGPFTIEEIRSKTASNTIGHDYLAQGDGETHWTRVGVLLGDSSQPSKHENNQNSAIQSFAIKRYADAYLVARTITGIGGLIKIAAFIIGSCIAILALARTIARCERSWKSASSTRRTSRGRGFATTSVCGNRRRSKRLISSLRPQDTRSPSTRPRRCVRTRSWSRPTFIITRTIR